VRRNFKIITVGFSPAWDITFRADALDWGEHKVISRMSRTPAGKALNISRALAWAKVESVAAGLWGKSDFKQMLDSMRPLNKLVKVKMTPADGSTRQNFTIVDMAKNRDIHLRSKSDLATRISVKKLRSDLRAIVGKSDICVFAGAMPDGALLNHTVGVIKDCFDAKARIAVDTSGLALKKIVAFGNLWLIKPNVDELGELLGKQIEDEAHTLVKAAKELLDKVEIVLVSRGAKGAVVVCRQGCWQARVIPGPKKTASTVGCGDYLLAGFLKGMKETGDIRYALETGLKLASARVWGWWEKRTWKKAEKTIRIKIAKL